RDERPRKRGAQQINTFVDGVCFYSGEDEVAHEFFAQVLDVELRRTGLKSLLLEPAEFFGLTYIGRETNDLARVGFFQPPQYYGRIQSARVCEHNLVDFLLLDLHQVLRCPPMPQVRASRAGRASGRATRRSPRRREQLH